MYGTLRIRMDSLLLRLQYSSSRNHCLYGTHTGPFRILHPEGDSSRRIQRPALEPTASL
jgi:hypothetical protein